MLGAAIFSLQVHFIVDYMHLCFFKKKKKYSFTSEMKYL